MRLNRKYAELYPVPMILGIEEYLDGPILSYINELGYVAFGFEGGQHEDPQAVINHTLGFTGCLVHEDIAFRHAHETLTNASRGVHDVYEIFYRHEIGPDDAFFMNPDFINFEKVKKGRALAQSNGEFLSASKSGRIFMPLYQKQGDDGYFLIRRIPRFVLKLSDGMRKLRMDRLFAILPGIRWESQEKEALIVDRSVARFFTREIFHLFGYRRKVIDDKTVRMTNREAVARDEEYVRAPWNS